MSRRQKYWAYEILQWSLVGVIVALFMHQPLWHYLALGALITIIHLVMSAQDNLKEKT